MTKSLLHKKAPAFTLKDSKENTVRLRDFAGSWVILYFYPRDNTPGCTKEACAFEASRQKFKRRDAVILGISPDSSSSHKKFEDKYSLRFPLLSDPEKTVAKKYGTYVKKNMYGKEAWGIERSTFIISPEQKIVWEARKVKVDGHIDEVLTELKELHDE